MPISLNALNKPIRFYWPDGDGKEWVDLRVITQSVLRRLKDTCINETRVEFYQPNRKRQPYRYEIPDVDENRLEREIWDYQIADWYLVDEEGNKIDCTLENKLILVNEEPRFLSWIDSCLDELTRMNHAHEKELEKNLSASQKGSGKRNSAAKRAGSSGS